MVAGDKVKLALTNISNSFLNGVILEVIGTINTYEGVYCKILYDGRRYIFREDELIKVQGEK